MTEAKRPLKVFLCHAPIDSDAVRKLYNRMTNSGLNAWLDEEKLIPGQDREYEIRKAVRAADVVVVCLSKQFNQAGIQQKEVRIALDTAMEQLEGEIFIVPARLEECDVPENLQRYHWVDLFDDDGYEKLLRSLRFRDEQLEMARIRKEEAVKRRLPFFETPVVRVKETQQASEDAIDIANKPHEDIPSPVSITKPEHPKSTKQLSRKKTKGRKRIKTEYVIAIIGAAATIVAGILSSPLIEKWFSPISVATEKATAAFTLTSQPIIPSQTLESTFVSATTSVTITPTAGVALTTTPLPTEITDAKRVHMVLIPAGEFTMGSDNGDSNEQPVHQVYLDSFYIDKFEVTNAQYKTCVDLGACKVLSNTQYYIRADYANRPVTYINWDMAVTYCSWRGDGTRLPTEAEWEKAARGPGETNYPWGNSIDCSYANYRGKNKYCVGDSSPVGHYEKGKSFYGVYDMVGNAMEWVSSAFAAYPYSATDGRERLNTNEPRIVRGGSWNSLESVVRVSNRAWTLPSKAEFDFGFRCAKDVTP